MSCLGVFELTFLRVDPGTWRCEKPEALFLKTVAYSHTSQGKSCLARVAEIYIALVR